MASAPRSLLAPWIGGASKPKSSPVAFRSFMVFWVGGAAKGAVVPPTPATSEYITLGRRRGRR